MKEKLVSIISRLLRFLTRVLKNIKARWNSENSLLNGVVLMSIIAVAITTLLFVHDTNTQELREEYLSTGSAIDRFSSKYDDLKIYAYLLMLSENAYPPGVGEAIWGDSRNMMRQARLADLRLSGFTFGKTREEIDTEIDKMNNVFEFLNTTTMKNIERSGAYYDTLRSITSQLDRMQSLLFSLLVAVSLFNIILAAQLSYLGLKRRGSEQNRF